MGKVNVVLPGGKVVSVDEDVANQSSFSSETPQQEVERGEQDRRDDAFGGVLGTAAEGLQSFGDTVTFGGLGKAESALGGDDWSEAQQSLAQEHPVARVAGMVAGIMDPVGAVGSAARVGESVGAAAGSKLLGRAIEGGLFGAGAHVADTNVTGDPLTIEGLVEGAGVGALLNMGVGAVADGIMGAGQRAARVAEEAGAIDSKIMESNKFRDTERLFQQNPESWKGYTDAVGSAVDSQQEVYDVAAKAVKKYEDFVGNSSKFDGAMNATEKAINAVSRYWKDDVTADAVAGTVAKDRAGLQPKFDLSDTNAEMAAERAAHAPPAALDAAASKGVPNEIPTPAATGGPSKPVVSSEMADRLKELRTRLRRIEQLRSGGYAPGETKMTPWGERNWVKDAKAVASPKQAAEELRKLNQDLRGQFPTASRRVKLADIPAAPPDAMPPQPPEFDIPRDLRHLSRQSPETIQKLANFTAADQSVQLAYQKLANDIGVDAKDGITGLHAKLRGWQKASDDLVAVGRRKEQEATADGFVGMARRSLKKFVKYGASRAADTALGGHWMGALGRVVAGEGVGAGMSAVEDTAIGGALLSGKATVRNKLAETVAQFARPTAAATRRLGPVLSNLSKSFPSGKVDREKDPRKLAANRIRELAAAQQTAPDNMFTALQGMMGHPSNVALKVHQFIAAALGHLVTTMPKDPGTATHMFGSDWLPSLSDTYALAHRLEAVTQPLTAVARSLAGDGHPAATQTLQTVWPNVMGEAAGELAWNAPKMNGATYQQAAGPSQTFGAPLTGLQNPVISSIIQSMYAPPPQGPAPRSSGTGGPTGRPPAVSNPVAGSSVSALLN